MKFRHVPGRLATGSLILNSGLSMLFADDQAAAGLHGTATGSYPIFKRINYRLFTKLLAGGEIALGTALLLPVVPTTLAASGLAAFSAGLVGPLPSDSRDASPR